MCCVIFIVGFQNWNFHMEKSNQFAKRMTTELTQIHLKNQKYPRI